MASHGERPVAGHGLETRPLARVLVAYATANGSTAGVAERIGATLTSEGLRADVDSVAEAGDPGRYEAIVLGSPVYDQAWLPEAERFAAENRESLGPKPVWLFSVGSFGDDKRLIGSLMAKEPRNIPDLRKALHPRGYRVFAGRIERHQWPLPARLLYHALGGRMGDNRDWPAIDAWAREIAATVSRETRVG